MLVKVHKDDSTKPRSKDQYNQATHLENMTITFYPELSLFLQRIDDRIPIFHVTYSPPNSLQKSLEVELEPKYDHLEQVQILLHQSPTLAYNMGAIFNDWFSRCFGYDVMLVYLGPHRRPVLGSFSPNAAAARSHHWLPGMVTGMNKVFSAKGEEKDGITFTDVAPYLVITEESWKNASSRLSDTLKLDITKFRPNIVVSGSEEAWDEDYWGGLLIGDSLESNAASNGRVEIILTQNCARCVSINIDYSTGQAGKGEEGTVLKKLMKDRRVDKGTKYAPIFGRYGFLPHNTSTDYQNISVGDNVVLSKRNAERTKFGKAINFNIE